VPIGVAVGLLALGWLLNTPAGLLGKADAVGYAVCHRIDLRSFHLGDRQVALCARCTGMYLGAALGLVYQALAGARRGGMPPGRVMVVLAALTLAFGVDGTNSFLSLIPGAPHLYEPSNSLRLLTGTGMGLVIASALYPAFHQSAWAGWDRRPAVDGLGSLGGLLALGVALDAFILTGNPLLLYPLTIISAATVIVILTLVYTVLGLMVLRAENRFQAWRKLSRPLTAGLGVALLQIAAFDVVRFWLTGTWAGFHLG
jgi:uncharacterized membrane protein